MANSGLGTTASSSPAAKSALSGNSGLPGAANMLYEIMVKKRNRPERVPANTNDHAYEAVLAGVIQLLELARHAAARSVNSIMTATYWEVGGRIVDDEQRGKHRAGYGEQLVTRMSQDLTRRCGRGFGYRNLYQMRQFYLAYPRILQTASAKPGQGKTTLATLGKNFLVS